MFSKGQIVFAVLFAVSFVVAIVMAFKKERAQSQGYLRRIKKGSIVEPFRFSML